MINDDQSGAMEIVCGEIRAEIRAMPEDGTVFHESVTQKDFLTGNYIRSRKEDLSAGSDDLQRDWWLVGVCSIGQDAEDKKAT